MSVPKIIKESVVTCRSCESMGEVRKVPAVTMQLAHGVVENVIFCPRCDYPSAPQGVK